MKIKFKKALVTGGRIMAEQLRKTAQTESWKALVTRLPGVLGAEFILAGDDIREVHILSDQSRTPKQVVRDVQSAMLARFQVELDHRMVSVAQIPGSIREARHRLVCDRLSLTTGRTGGSVSVTLLLEDREYSGETACDLSGAARTRAVALASVEALNKIFAPACAVTLEDVRRVNMDEGGAVLVGLMLRIGRRAERLLGACYEGEDPNLSVVHATLDAVNRRFLTLELSDHGGPLED